MTFKCRSIPPNECIWVVMIGIHTSDYQEFQGMVVLVIRQNRSFCDMVQYNVMRSFNKRILYMMTLNLLCNIGRSTSRPWTSLLLRFLSLYEKECWYTRYALYSRYSHHLGTLFVLKLDSILRFGLSIFVLGKRMALEVGISNGSWFSLSLYCLGYQSFYWHYKNMKHIQNRFTSPLT